MPGDRNTRVPARLGAATLVAAIGVCTLAAAVRADEPPAGESPAGVMARAQVLFDEGQELLDAGDYEQACARFEASLGLVQGVGTRGKLAECYERAGRTASAWLLYREVERLARESGNQLRERVARDRASALEGRLARLTIEPGPSVTAPGFEILKNRIPLPPRDYGMARIVDPGAYKVEASATGRRSFATEVRVKAGEHATVRVTALRPIDERSLHPSRLRTVSYGLIAAGALGVFGGGLFGQRARSRWGQAFDGGHCDEQTRLCDGAGLDLTSSARHNANLANLSVGLGLVSAGVGVYLLVRSRSGKPDGGTRALTGLGITPTATRDRLSLSMRGRF